MKFLAILTLTLVTLNSAVFACDVKQIIGKSGNLKNETEAASGGLKNETEAASGGLKTRQSSLYLGAQ